MINDIYSLVLGLDLRNGETKRMDCPNCKGYKTFTATNNMGSLVWNCYKAYLRVQHNKAWKILTGEAQGD